MSSRQRSSSYNGNLGGALRTVQTIRYVFPLPLVLILHSDGVSRFQLESKDLLKRSALEIAKEVFSQKKNTDDTTALVVKGFG
jgi:hypothetical protein